MPDEGFWRLPKSVEAAQRKILVRAEAFNDADARDGMGRIAASYEELADRLEKQA
jgi:hypothetical protein